MSKRISTTRALTSLALDMKLDEWDLVRDKSNDYWRYWDEKTFWCWWEGQVIDVTDDDIELRRRPHLTHEDLDRELDEYMNRYRDLRQRLRDAVQRVGVLVQLSPS
jgi:hypothetical protein